MDYSYGSWRDLPNQIQPGSHVRDVGQDRRQCGPPVAEPGAYGGGEVELGNMPKTSQKPWNIMILNG